MNQLVWRLAFRWGDHVKFTLRVFESSDGQKSGCLNGLDRYVRRLFCDRDIGHTVVCGRHLTIR